jgi:hypothetical protein
MRAETQTPAAEQAVLHY